MGRTDTKGEHVITVLNFRRAIEKLVRQIAAGNLSTANTLVAGSEH